MEPRGLAPRFPACKAGVVLLDHGPRLTGVGVEPTQRRLSTCGLYQLAYPDEQLQTWELNPATGLMKPSRAPARLQSVVTVGFEPTHNGF